MHTITLHSSSWPKKPYEDVDYDFHNAHSIMRILHEKKQGVKFSNVTIKLDSSASKEEKPRTFHSRLDVSGEYERWGSEEVVTEKIIEVSDDETSNVEYADVMEE